jgi:hypothetical protein
VNPLFDIGYRIVAVAVCIYFGRTVWHGFAERKITVFNTDLLDWWTPSQVFHRDGMPIRYWMFMCGRAVTTVLCFIAAIIGWQSNT